MNNYLLLVFFFFIFLLNSCDITNHKNTKDTRPNIIFIFSDDHTNNAIGVYGNQFAKTPNIDRIANEGAIFTNFFVTNSICGPSRAALLTGKYSHINGFITNDTKFDIDQLVFSRLLSESGYQTAWVGKWHLETLPGDTFDYWNILPDQGHYFNPDFISQQNDTLAYEGYVTDIITKISTDWIDKRDRNKPFFIVVGEKATHREWLPDIQDLGAYDHIDFPIPATFYDDYKHRIAASNQDMTIAGTMTMDFDLKVNIDYEKNWIYNRLNEKQLSSYKSYYQDKISNEFNKLKLSGKELAEWKFQRYMRDYLSTANSLDRNIGRILDYLKKNDLSENTIIVYGSDQGFYLGEHGWFDKRFIYEESLRTPFVICYPEVIKPGTIVNQFLMNIDWAPTLLEIAGIDVPKEIQGTSFLPILYNRQVPWRDQVYYHYYEYPQPHRVMPHFGIRTERYKLVRFYGEQNFWELYDLKKDPTELHNMYDEFSDHQTLDQLKNRLRQLTVDYEDDLAYGILVK